MRDTILESKIRKWKSRRTRTRSALGVVKRPMVTVYRSSKHIYAQLIEPGTGRTLGTVSSLSSSVVGDTYPGNIEAAKKVGAALAELAKKNDIQQVVFNRNGFLFHGRVKALAEAAREAGLQF